MNQLQIDSLRDFAIEHLPRAKADREQVNRFGLSHEALYIRLAGITVSVRAKASTTAIEFAAANVLDCVSMLCLVQEPPLTTSQRTNVLGRLAKEAKELCSLTGKTIAWLDAVPASPEPEEPEDKTPAPAAPIQNQIPSIAGRFLTTAEAAKALGIAEQTMRKWASTETGPVRPSSKVGKTHRWSGDEILAHLRRK